MNALTNEGKVLRDRIINGYVWLTAHPDHVKFFDALKMYESLVDQAKALGIKEEDCRPVTEQDVQAMMF